MNPFDFDLLHDPLMGLSSANKILYKLTFTGYDRAECVKAAKMVQGTIDELEEIVDQLLTYNQEEENGSEEKVSEETS